MDRTLKLTPNEVSILSDLLNDDLTNEIDDFQKGRGDWCERLTDMRNIITLLLKITKLE